MGIDHRRFKDELYAEFARIGGALGSPKRIEILDLLAQRPWSVEELAGETGLSFANTSRHLQVLAQARLVDPKRRGSFVDYRVASLEVVRLCRALQSVATDRLAEVAVVNRRQRGDVANVMEPAAVRELLARDAVVLLDVRPEPEFRAAHIRGARSIPAATLERRGGTSSLPRDREIVVYCRGAACVWADEAVVLLRRRGFRASRLSLGAPDWALAGGELDVAG